ncbi:hypothetical protein [Mycobacterium tuberculosis]|uniref:hypothetical protein n=1 Tax=Mycobacterium tuberculosis TaxID=1773 RepID=UPI00272C8C2A|nr:hypothetical protein [Mycobacterium tuberculosis]
MYGQDVGVAIVLKDSQKLEPADLKSWMAERAVRQALAILQQSLERPNGFEPKASERTFKILLSALSNRYWREIEFRI